MLVPVQFVATARSANKSRDMHASAAQARRATVRKAMVVLGTFFTLIGGIALVVAAAMLHPAAFAVLGLLPLVGHVVRRILRSASPD